jgi:hypothetical protein
MVWGSDRTHDIAGRIQIAFSPTSSGARHAGSQHDEWPIVRRRVADRRTVLRDLRLCGTYFG